MVKWLPSSTLACRKAPTATSLTELLSSGPSTSSNYHYYPPRAEGPWGIIVGELLIGSLGPPDQPLQPNFRRPTNRCGDMARSLSECCTSPATATGEQTPHVHNTKNVARGPLCNPPVRLFFPVPHTSRNIRFFVFLAHFCDFWRRHPKRLNKSHFPPPENL